MSTELPKEKKLTVLCRVEPGCLGPDGLDHIESFCRFSHQELKKIDSDFIKWLPLPRYDKSLAEMEYSVDSKLLSRDKASQYLAHFKCELDEFEEHFHDKLSTLINEFLANNKAKQN
ncbi:hypothetical protein [Shewanella woodyi]|uniref:Putative orphan protein n=1 Tax=Shewanella woodyi (strain ATCC 51908 / MS32) TaxID=392500 RepID=B1KFC3_SHEWM|nr:hypothetical protein [Shewanella woodyi]ACA86664.1 putative orphan protein [Shewanella woodyi ATCC 51908]